MRLGSGKNMEQGNFWKFLSLFSCVARSIKKFYQHFEQHLSQSLKISSINSAFSHLLERTSELSALITIATALSVQNRLRNRMNTVSNSRKLSADQNDGIDEMWALLISTNIAFVVLFIFLKALKFLRSFIEISRWYFHFNIEVCSVISNFRMITQH